MKISRKSPRTGVLVERDLPITEEQYAAWKAGALIQDVMPFLPAEDREWILTGYTKADWDALFPADE